MIRYIPSSFLKIQAVQKASQTNRIEIGFNRINNLDSNLNNRQFWRKIKNK